MLQNALPAIFGLLGVIVGGLLNGVVLWRIERKRAGLASVAAARIVRAELDMCRKVVELTLKDKDLALVYNPDVFGVPSWSEHRVMLSECGLQYYGIYQIVQSAVDDIELLAHLEPNTKWTKKIERHLKDQFTKIERSQYALEPICKGDHLHLWRKRHMLDYLVIAAMREAARKIKTQREKQAEA